MTNIYDDIKKLIFDSTPDHLIIRADHRRYLVAFLNSPNEKNADNLFDFVYRIHRKEGLYRFMSELRKYEKGFHEINPELKKHYCHSASVYALGLAMYNNSEALRAALQTDRHPTNDFNKQKSSFLFRWSLAACNHDLAYPLELSVNSFNQYAEQIHGISKDDKKFMSIDQSIFERLNFLSILKPYESIDIEKKDTITGLIAQNLTRHHIDRVRVTSDTLRLHLEQIITNNLKDGRIDHGVFSALIVLKRIHELYEINSDWNIRDFYYEVVDAATAIFLHNIYRFTDLKEIFGQGKYHYDFPNSIGYLLFVCDTLCEWSRMNLDEKEYFGINIHNGRIYFNIRKEFKNRLVKPLRIIDRRPIIMIKWQDYNQGSAQNNLGR